MSERKLKIKLNVVNHESGKIDESMTIEDVVRVNPPAGWPKLFEDYIDEIRYASRELEKLEQSRGRWYPKKEDVFRIFHVCPLRKVRVVILGQDPYPDMGADGKPRPVGMSFSVRKTDIIPRSLQNIYSALSIDLGKKFRVPRHGDLTKWAEQGVFLLNTALTVEPDNPGSHLATWKAFTIAVLEAIGRRNPNCIYVLWGAHAKSLAPELMNPNPKHILHSSHPVKRGDNSEFFNCKHFSKINEILEGLGDTPIDWSLDSDDPSSSDESGSDS